LVSEALPFPRQRPGRWLTRRRGRWLDQPDAPEPLPALAGRVSADLAVVGGGFTGLWTALLARERDPSRRRRRPRGPDGGLGRVRPPGRVAAPA
jgi:hypothetical protein